MLKKLLLNLIRLGDEKFMDMCAARMEAFAQFKYIECLKLGIQFIFHAPNRFCYMYRKNMLEPSIREKYCRDHEYCIWIETLHPETLQVVDLKVKGINQEQIVNWPKLID